MGFEPTTPMSELLETVCPCLDRTVTESDKKYLLFQTVMLVNVLFPRESVGC